MYVTKLTHSCLLIEKDGKKILVDPGIYSWKNDKVKSSDFSGISAVLVTHNHPDHLNDDFAHAIKLASPNATWYGTRQAIEKLQDLGIQCLPASKDQDIQFIESEHADLSPWFDEQPQHTSYAIFGDILVSGDCQTLTDSHGARVLAAAINGGPWGAVVGFCKMIESMSDRPKIVIPLHDWHWNENARDAIYTQLVGVLDKFGVKFIPLVDCAKQEI